jgi:hypothetical protein
MMTDAADEDICFITADGAEFAVDVNVDADLSGSGDVNVGNNLFVYNNSAQLWGGLDLNSVGITATGPIAGATTVSASSTLHVGGNATIGRNLAVRGAQQISFGTKLTGYANTIASPFYRVYPVDTAALTGSTLVTLPAITAATHGLELTIKDIGNNAATYAINVTGATGTGDRIDSSATYKAIATNSGWSTIVAQSGSSGTHVWYQIAGRAW